MTGTNESAPANEPTAGAKASAAGAEANRHEEAPTADNDPRHVKLEVFEGPLDLLLHLIRKHELDIFDIPVSFITKRYLEYLEVMRSLHIDVASEFLVMAATLAHIKSRTLLPRDDADDGAGDTDLVEEDPRTELVRRLLEYQKYRLAAAQLGRRATLGRDVFARGSREPADASPGELAPVSVFRLFDAFEKVLERAHQTADHEVLFERVSLTERIVEITERLTEQRRIRFEQLFELGPGEAGAAPGRQSMVLTFLALLEMCKMRIAEVSQDEVLGELFVHLAHKRIDTPDTAHRTAPTSAAPAGEHELADHDGHSSER